MPEMPLPVQLADNVRSAINDALEQMFFSGITAESAAPSDAVTCARVRFSGTAAGQFRVAASTECLTELASNFLAMEAEDVSADAALSVLLELANILCGSVLSRWHPDGLFELAAPETDEYDGTAEWQAFQTETGWLGVAVHLGEQVTA